MHPYTLYKFHSTFYSLKSAKEYVVQNTQRATDSLPSKYNSKNTNQAYAYPLLISLASVEHGEQHGKACHLFNGTVLLKGT